MKLEFQEYRARKIVNVHKHVDGPWFWGKYTARPYVGCRCGCEFCYARGGRYLGKRDPDTFDTLIGIKTNAVDLLRKELPRLEKEIISVGDWQQPAEDRYRLSRGMLQVVLEHGFALYINERSPLLTRDLDLLTEINHNAWAGVAYSLSGVEPALKQAFEPRSPGVKRRLQAMAELAAVGIQVGASLMPILPFVGDDKHQLDETICAIKDHGGSFVLGGALTMDGVQADRTLVAAWRLHRPLAERWRVLYGWQEGGKPSYGPPADYVARLGLLVRELCARHGLLDRLPRYIAPGPLAINKRIAERLFLQAYDQELEGAQQYRIWAYRKGAWAVDECSESVATIYADRGEVGLQELPGVGKSLAARIAGWLQEEGDQSGR